MTDGSICFSNEVDFVIWKYESNGVFSSSSLYKVVTNRGVMPVFLPFMWKIVVPPKIHIFLRLLANNKIMITDNMDYGEKENGETFGPCLV